MIAVILAAGVGSRLMPLTKDIPKCLVKINNKTILDIELENIYNFGINKFIIVTGYKGRKIRKYINKRYPELNILFVNNKKYNSTNYIYSLWLTKDLIDDDVLLLHGDIVFEKEVLKKLLDDQSPNGVLITDKIGHSEKDFKAIVKNNLINKININYSGENKYYCSPIYKLTEGSFKKWLKEIDLFIKDGKLNCYAEDAFNKISEEIKLIPIYYNDKFCMEIDTLEDLKIAKDIITKDFSIQKLYYTKNSMPRNNLQSNPYEKEMVETLRRVVTVLENNSILYWVDAGTLLGLIRDGKIIPWDDDVEIGAWIEDMKKIKNCIHEFKNQGLIITKHTPDKLGIQLPDNLPYKFRILFYKIRNGKAIRGKLVSLNKIGSFLKLIINICQNPEEIEKINIKYKYDNIGKMIILILIKLFPIIFIKKMRNFLIYVHTKFKFKERYSFEIPCEFFENFEQKKFYDIELRVPTKAQEYLLYKYGDDWHIPKRYWIDYSSTSRVLRHK